MIKSYIKFKIRKRKGFLENECPCCGSRLSYDNVNGVYCSNCGWGKEDF